MNYNDVDYKSVPTDEECILTAVKIGELIKEPPSTVRKWAEYHENNLYIKKVNGRFVYTQKCVEQFEFIKKLIREKGMTHEQVRQYMSKHGTECGDYSNGIINPQDPFGYEVLSSAIAQKTENELGKFLKAFMQYQEENNNKQLERIDNALEQSEIAIQEKLSLSEERINKSINEHIESLEKQNKAQYEDLLKEIAVTKDMNSKLDNLRDIMNQRKEENQKEEKKGFWSRLFKG